MPIDIPLDRKWLARRDGDDWSLLLKDDKGVYREKYSWTGPRRSLYSWMELHRIQPSHKAEAELNRLPEQTGFRPDEEVVEK